MEATWKVTKVNSPQDQRYTILHNNNKKSCEHHHLVFIQVECCALVNTSLNINAYG